MKTTINKFELKYYYENILPNIDFSLYYDDSNLLQPVKNIKKYLIGEVFYNKDGNQYKIIKCYKGNSKRLIEFTDTKYKTIVESKELESGIIKDPFSPSVCNIGVVGEAYFTPKYSKDVLYRRWRDMINRCYNINKTSYIDYGAKGVAVSQEWLYYPNFYKDILKKPHYKDLIDNPSMWDLDKDEICSDKKINKIYSNNTVQIVNKTYNIQLRNKEHGLPVKKSKKVLQYDKLGNFIKEWDSSVQASLSLYNDKKYYHYINACCRGKCKTTLNFIWRYKDEQDNN